MGDARGIGGPEDNNGAIISLWCNWADDPEILKTLLAEFNREPLGAGEGTSSSSGGAGAEDGSSAGDGGEESGKAEEKQPQGGVEGGESSDVHLHLSEVSG